MISKAMIGKAIIKLREQRGITKTQLSEITGISLPSISQYENGNRNPSDVNLEKIAEALDVSINRLKEHAEDIERSYVKAPPVDDYQYKRRIEFIMRHNDVVIELKDSVFLTFNIRVHDVINEITNRERVVVSPRNRLPSGFEAIVDKVIRDLIYDNLDNIADRVNDELHNTGVSVEDFIREINENKYRY